MNNSKADSISVLNSILLLSDYQENFLKEIKSGDKNDITNSAVASAQAANILHVPVILTAINPELNGKFIREISDIPLQEIILRHACIDALEDKNILKAIRKRGREKLIIGGLYTSGCISETAIHGINEGFDVYCLTDACGDISNEAHVTGMQKILAAGATPITWMALTTEWMNGGADTSEREESFGKYGAMLSYLSKQISNTISS